MAEFGKVDPNKAQAIINALKDGRINQKEAENLGLTAQEAEELNKAFSSGEVQVGDFVLVNKGKTKDGKKQITETKMAESEDEKAFKSLGKQAYDFFIGRHVEHAKNIVRPFVKAWNNNDGAENVAKAMPQAFKESAKAAGNAVVDNLTTAAKVGITVLGGGLTSCTSDITEPTTVNQTGNQSISVTLSGLNEKSSSADAIKILKELVNNQEKIIEEIKNQGKKLEDILAILGAILQREIEQGNDIKVLLDLAQQAGVNLEQVVAKLTENNQLLSDIKNDNNNNTQKILEAIDKINASVKSLEDQIKKLPDKFRAEFEGDLTAIYNAIKEGNVSLGEIQGNIQSLAAKLEANLDKIYKQAQANGKTQNEILKILEKIKNGDSKDYTQILLDMLDVLKNIDFTTQDTNQTVKDIKAEIADMKADLKTLVNNSNYISSRVDNIAKTEEQQKALLEAILAAIKAVGSSNTAENQAILEALLKQGNDLKDIMAVLNSINKNVVKGNETTENYGKQILAAIKAGNVDLSKLVELNKHIDEDQHKIIANQDVTIGIGNAILEWLKNHKPNGGNNVDYTAILTKMSKQLDDILAAIKDHEVHVTVDDLNITVDVTGKVKCECTCSDGHKHEGIIGDLGVI